MLTQNRLEMYDAYADLAVALTPLWRILGLWTEEEACISPILNREDASPARRVDALFLTAMVALVRAQHDRVTGLQRDQNLIDGCGGRIRGRKDSCD